MAQNILAPLEITVPASAIDAGIQKQKRKHGSGTTTLIISNKEMNDIMLFGTLRASLLGKMLAWKGMLRAGYGNEMDF